MLRTHDLVDLTQKGIPDKYRSDIWMVYSGALDLQVATCSDLVITCQYNFIAGITSWRVCHASGKIKNCIWFSF